MSLEPAIYNTFNTITAGGDINVSGNATLGAGRTANTYNQGQPGKADISYDLP